MLTRLLRCDECGVKLWALRQGTQAGTYYKSPTKDLDPGCVHRGRSFSGKPVESEVDLLLSGFVLREDWIDYVMENYVRDVNPKAALRNRESVSQKLERAKHLYINGDLDWGDYSRMKDEA